MGTIKKIIKYLVLIFGYILLIFGLICGIFIIWGGNVALSTIGIIVVAVGIYFIIPYIIVIVIMTRLHDKSHRYWLIPIILGLLVIGLNLLPNVGVVFTINDAENQFNKEFGGDYFGSISPEMRSKFSPNPILFNELIRGVHIADCNVSINEDYYSKRGDDKYHFDLYSPKTGTGPYPIIIAIHGGGWKNGDKGQFSSLNRYLAAQGYVIFDIRYGLAINLTDRTGLEANFLGQADYNHSITLPQIVENIGNFTHYLVRNKQKYNIDINNTFIMGRSAGGHLTGLFLGYNTTFKNLFNTSLKIRGLIPFYLVSNMTNFYNYAMSDPTSKASGYGSDFFYYLFENDTPSTNITKYNIYSPINHVSNESPPILILHGGKDNLVPISDSIELQKKMHSYNRTCILVRFPFMGHAFDGNPLGYQVSRYYIERFLAYNLENS